MNSSGERSRTGAVVDNAKDLRSPEPLPLCVQSVGDEVPK